MLSKVLGFLFPVRRMAITSELSPVDACERLRRVVDTETDAISWWLGNHAKPGRVRGDVNVDMVKLIVEPPFHDRRFYVPYAMGAILSTPTGSKLLLTVCPRPFQIVLLLFFVVGGWWMADKYWWMALAPITFHLVGCIVFLSEYRQLGSLLSSALKS